MILSSIHRRSFPSDVWEGGCAQFYDEQGGSRGSPRAYVVEVGNDAFGGNKDSDRDLGGNI